MIYFAYDGSIDGDWVSRYAIQMAARSSPPVLHLVHVHEHESEPNLANKIERIAHECRLRGVVLSVSEKPSGQDMFATLTSMLDPAGLVVCGMRTRSHKAARRGYLKDSVARRLLEHRAFDVLAVKVLHPGFLGVPHRLLLPFHPVLPLPQTGLRFLRLMAADLHRIHLLELIPAGRIPLRPGFRGWLSHQRQAAVRRLAVREAELAKLMDAGAGRFDSSIRSTDAWPHEVVVRAGRHKSQLIFMGLPERSLLQRVNGVYPVEEVLRDAPCDVAIFGGKR
jgi:hypothetical protein